MNFKAAIANSLWLGSNLSAYARFKRALTCPAETQAQLLRDYLSQNADSAYGRAHGFAQIKSYEEFARQVPLNDYEHLQPWIGRIARGEPHVLTWEPVSHLVPTSGSSNARKLIPFTAGLQREFNRAIGPWTADICRQHPPVALGTAYWSISPAVPIENAGSSTVPVGFEDDAAYLGGVRQQMVKAIMAAPSELRLVSNMEIFRYLTLLCLLRRADLRLISVWHPSFLSLLLDVLPVQWRQLLDDIKTGKCRYADVLPPKILSTLRLCPAPRRARELARLDPHDAAKIWPRLKIISCWGDAHADFARSELQRRFPLVHFQAKGLLATEAVVTIPFGRARPLAVGSHFFEFIDEQGKIHRAHELRVGQHYEVVVTTGGGLWRYCLKDLVQVMEFVGPTPSLRFLGRAQNISDRRGEKLSETFIAQCLQTVMTCENISPRFVLLAPEATGSDCHYTLFIEGKITGALAAQTEKALAENPHYAWCRQLGQLKPLRIFQISAGGYETFAARELRQGKQLGEIKPGSLSTKTDWAEHFAGNYCRAPGQEDAS